ncbi:glycoside hydrolase family 78 protein [soil metagenome]
MAIIQLVNFPALFNAESAEEDAEPRRAIFSKTNKAMSIKNSTLFLFFLTLIVLVICNEAQTKTAAKVAELKCEYLRNPVGIDVKRPRLSWQIESGEHGLTQIAYQIRVARSEAGLAGKETPAWDSGKVSSGESTQIAYSGPEQRSGERVHWQVKVWLSNGEVASSSESAYWEMGLLQTSDWLANWIEPEQSPDVSKPSPAPMLRRSFSVRGDVVRARAYVTSRGLYEMQLNGNRVSDHLFTPGWTSYNNRLQYQVYDVTDRIKTGENAVGVTLGDGWYRGIGYNNYRYGDRLALLMQIRITYRDGKEETIVTDKDWKFSTGPILMSKIYDGETYDARLEIKGWSQAGFVDDQWTNVRLADYPKDDLVATMGNPVRAIQEIKPITVFKTPAGDTVADMGQNMVGWVRLKVKGPAGTRISIHHAEVFDKEGNVYLANLRGAKQVVQYTLKGGGMETYEPHFTFQGFRYVAISGYPGELTPDDLTGIVIHSDMQQTSEFETSNPLINQLQHNIIWGQKGNFLDVPTDCPQRDERMGWTGDAQMFAPTAEFNMDVSAFYTKWLKDMAADQLESGSIPHVIPDILSRPNRPQGGSAAWADAAVIIPWTMYLSYGDKRILADQYPTMKKWVEYERKRAGDDYVWDGDPHFGDWLAFATNLADYPGATTGKDLIATAFFAHSTELLGRTAKVLGKTDDEKIYGELLEKIKAAFCREYVSPSGRIGENTQTAYTLALQFDLLPENLRAEAAERLAKDVRSFKHITTGFVGTPYICNVLSRYGYWDEAFMLLKNENYPSWLYPVKHGATTIWERWDGQKPDGSFQDPGMNSFNHYAYGAVGEWMYRNMSGIKIDESVPGYKHILIEPHPGGGFRTVSASHETLYGKVISAWVLTGNSFELTVKVPVNTTATLRLPKAGPSVVEQLGNLAKRNIVLESKKDGDSVLVTVGSGGFSYSYEMIK